MTKRWERRHGLKVYRWLSGLLVILIGTKALALDQKPLVVEANRVVPI